jgi:hypothetical protein
MIARNDLKEAARRNLILAAHGLRVFGYWLHWCTKAFSHQEAIMRFVAIRIFVHDLTVARRFYQETLGLPLKWEYDAAALGFDAGGDLIVELVGEDADEKDRQLVGRPCQQGRALITRAIFRRRDTNSARVDVDMRNCGLLLTPLVIKLCLSRLWPDDLAVSPERCRVRANPSPNFEVPRRRRHIVADCSYL